MKLKVGDKIFHKLANEEMLIVGIDKQASGTTVSCRRYIEKDKRFIQESFNERELEREKKVFMKFKTPEEQVKYWKEMIALAKSRLEGLEVELKKKSQ